MNKLNPKENKFSIIKNLKNGGNNRHTVEINKRLEDKIDLLEIENLKDEDSIDAEGFFNEIENHRKDKESNPKSIKL